MAHPLHTSKDVDVRFDALRDALARYRQGALDLPAAAEEAGLPEWDFLERAKDLPAPEAALEGSTLPTFVRRDES